MCLSFSVSNGLYFDYICSMVKSHFSQDVIHISSSCCSIEYQSKQTINV